jgi:lipid A ethanolaminephosphotransferase
MLDPDFRKSMGVDIACVAQQRTRPTSHDNLLHSVMGMLKVTTSACDQKLDVFPVACLARVIEEQPVQFAR